MGCDIHCYLEYRAQKDETAHWKNFGGRINPGRNYAMFGFLAGVRFEGPPVAEPRGVPEDCGYQSEAANRLFITDRDTDEEGFCTKEQAEQFVKYGAKYLPSDQDRRFVTHPDWHTHSWVTPDEWEKAIHATLALEPEYPLVEYEAVLAALRSFESQGYDARVVFWFDN